MHSPCVEDGLALTVIGRCALLVRLGRAEEEVRRTRVNFNIANLVDQDEVSSEATAFQREEVELAKPFLI